MLIFINVYEVEICKLILCWKTMETTQKGFLFLKSILFYLFVLPTCF